MRFRKEDFLNSNLGSKLQSILEHWNKAKYDEQYDTNKPKQKLYEAQWNIYEALFRDIYNKDCYIHQTHDYFGVLLCNKKGDEWLIKLDRARVIKDRHYTNHDKKCECYLCEYANICPVVNKIQRLPREKCHIGLGECWKLKE